MAISRRLRFEILRRDSHTCRYCGAAAPDVKLTVDHVIPSALGGSDKPSNLVTACVDCNSGKSSVPADSATVADVAKDALRWSQAISRAAQLQREDHWNADVVADWVEDHWRQVFADSLAWSVVYGSRWHYPADPERTYPHAVEHDGVILKLFDDASEAYDWMLAEQDRVAPPRPADWRQSIHQFYAAGFTDPRDFRRLMESMQSKVHMLREPWTYFCGAVWSVIEDRQVIARQLLEQEDE